MLLTITTTHAPASDLGYLLHKHPDKAQAFDLSFGRAHVYYPEVSDARCTAALLLEIDPVQLARAFRGVAGARLLEHYVNDRPYVASSFFSVAISEVFGSALAGRCKDRSTLADTAIPLQVKLAVVPVRGGASLLNKLFEPLGYEVQSQRHPLDSASPEWGDSHYYTVMLNATVRLADLLTHLYVLIPVLDQAKHYWVGDDEVEKLLRHGQAWLPTHPEKELITERYLKYRRRLARKALERMTDPEDVPAEEIVLEDDRGEEKLEKPLSLNEQRILSVVDLLVEHQITSVVDLGCGEGKLLRALMRKKTITNIIGMDVSAHSLEIAAKRLNLNQLPEKQKQRLRLLQGSLTYCDKRLTGLDAATLIEVIEHVDLDRLDALERVLFEYTKPRIVIVTTPNCEYNVKFENMQPGQFRHADHRFEWTREEFKSWVLNITTRFNYQAKFLFVGTEDPVVGPPTQMAVFTNTLEEKFR